MTKIKNFPTFTTIPMRTHDPSHKRTLSTNGAASLKRREGVHSLIEPLPWYKNEKAEEEREA